MSKADFIYTTYIKTTPEKLWDALTNAEFMKQYWFGMYCTSEWTSGLNRPGFVGGSNSQVGWSHDEPDHQQVLS
jgi:uncharacterized protein YndB with AHSA1/START domain